MFPRGVELREGSVGPPGHPWECIQCVFVFELCFPCMYMKQHVPYPVMVCGLECAAGGEMAVGLL